MNEPVKDEQEGKNELYKNYLTTIEIE